jgi:hypothetical protein
METHTIRRHLGRQSHSETNIVIHVIQGIAYVLVTLITPNESKQTEMKDALRDEIGHLNIMTRP